jgi:hypothetical protein
VCSGQRDEAGRSAGWAGVPAKLGSVLIANPQTACCEDGGEPVQIGGVLGTNAKTSYGKRVGVPAKLGVCLLMALFACPLARCHGDATATPAPKSHAS